MLNSNEICLPQSLAADTIGAVVLPNAEMVGDVHRRPLRKHADLPRRRPRGFAPEAGPGFAFAIPSLNEWLAEPMRPSSPANL
jgi:hypothetical protein